MTRPRLDPARGSPEIVTATLQGVIDCGAQLWYWEDMPRRVHEVRLVFEQVFTDKPAADRPLIEQRYHFSFWPRARLHQDIVGWLGRPLSKAERGAGRQTLSDLIDRSARLQIAWRGAYRVIVGIQPERTHWPLHRAPTLFWLDDFDPELWERLPPRLRDRIMESPTYLNIMGIDHKPWPAEYLHQDALEGDFIPW